MSDTTKFRMVARLRENIMKTRWSFVGFMGVAFLVTSLTGAADAVDLIRNGEFDEGLGGWRNQFHAQGKSQVETDKSSKISGASSAKVTVLHSSDKVYHIRLVQTVKVVKGAKYRLTATMAADAPMRARIGLQENRKPHRVVLMKYIDVNSSPSKFVLTGVNKSEDMTCMVQFDMGDQPEGRTLWIDKVSLIEEK